MGDLLKMNANTDAKVTKGPYGTTVSNFKPGTTDFLNSK